MPTKEELTRKVLEITGHQHAYDFESAMRLWWQDERDDGGLRLSVTGHKWFQEAEIESWTFPIEATVPARPLTLLMLKRHITMPYFLSIGKKFSITFYGSREATMYSLYRNIDHFVEMLKRIDPADQS